MDYVLLAVTPAPWNYLLGWTLSILAVFLILLILVQRGRGGGLAGALGGMGGQSAFGTKAGDLFTRVTIGVATVWILLCMLAIRVLNPTAGRPVFDKTEITLPSDTKLKDLDTKNKKRTDLPAEGDDPGARVPASESEKEKSPATTTSDDAAPPENKSGSEKSADPPAATPGSDSPPNEKAADSKSPATPSEGEAKKSEEPK